MAEATETGAKGKGAKEKPKAKQAATKYRIVELVSGTKEDPQELRVLDGVFDSNNGAGAARKKAYDSLTEAQQDAGITIAAIPIRNLDFHTRKAKVKRVSSED